MRTTRPVLNNFFIAVVLALAFISLHCGYGSFIGKEELKKFQTLPTSDHRIVHCSVKYRMDSDGKLFKETHTVLRVGENPRTAPQFLHVEDNSIEKLLSFHAQVLHKDGSSESYSASDLITMNLSNRYQIAERFVKYLGTKKLSAENDLIEEVSSHELTLPELGITLDLSEMGDKADNITCSIELPLNDSLRWYVANDLATPAITAGPETKTYSFHWAHYERPEKKFSFEKKNQSPQLLVALRHNAHHASQSWIAFGDWYLATIKGGLTPSDQIRSLAQELTKDKKAPKEKMDVIFEYCQRTIRYEQVYLAQGEFIPNTVSTIFSRKYADCKDYASLMYAMAHSVGIEPHLALCYRGRGEEFFGSIPVSQFNHCILEYSENGKEYWYDGTNRIGLPGITTDDLINAEALVLDEGKTRLVRIEEAPNNEIVVSGILHPKGSALAGKLAIEARTQYAIDFFYRNFFQNKNEMKEGIARWLHYSVNENMTISDLAWHSDNAKFIIEITCELPNVLTTVGTNTYVKFSRIFADLLPDIPLEENKDKLYYYPYYGHISSDVTIEGLRDETHTQSAPPLHWKFSSALPPGPFDAAAKKEFLAAYTETMKEFRQTYKCTAIAHQ